MSASTRALAELAGQLLSMGRTRLELFGTEALIARDRLLCRLALLLAALLFLMMALLVASVAFALYVWPGPERYLALALLALAYAVIAGGCAAWLLRLLQRESPPFVRTLEVLEADAAALLPGASDESGGAAGSTSSSGSASQSGSDADAEPS